METKTPVRCRKNPERVGYVLNPDPLSVYWYSGPQGEKVCWVEWAHTEDLEEIK